MINNFSHFGKQDFTLRYVQNNFTSAATVSPPLGRLRRMTDVSWWVSFTQRNTFMDADMVLNNCTEEEAKAHALAAYLLKYKGE